MTDQEKQYSLYEAIADISLHIGASRFITHNSRLVIEYIIEWAKEFEALHEATEWGVTTDLEYMEAIEIFTADKIKYAIENELGYNEN